jgi:hypothetical protein
MDVGAAIAIPIPFSLKECRTFRRSLFLHDLEGYFKSPAK